MQEPDENDDHIYNIARTVAGNVLTVKGHVMDINRLRRRAAAPPRFARRIPPDSRRWLVTLLTARSGTIYHAAALRRSGGVLDALDAMRHK